MLSQDIGLGSVGGFLLTSTSKHAHCVEVAAKRKIKGERKKKILPESDHS